MGFQSQCGSRQVGNGGHVPAQISHIERKLVLLLKEERERQGISANQLAARIKVDRSTITRLEADLARPTLWVLLLIAKGLGVRLSEILSKAEK